MSHISGRGQHRSWSSNTGHIALIAVLVAVLGVALGLGHGSSPCITTQMMYLVPDQHGCRYVAGQVRIRSSASGGASRQFAGLPGYRLYRDAGEWRLAVPREPME